MELSRPALFVSEWVAWQARFVVSLPLLCHVLYAAPSTDAQPKEEEEELLSSSVITAGRRFGGVPLAGREVGLALGMA